MDLKKEKFIEDVKLSGLNTVQDYVNLLTNLLPLSAFVLEDDKQRVLQFDSDSIFSYFLSFDKISRGIVTFNIIDSDDDCTLIADISLPPTFEEFETKIISKKIPEMLKLGLSVFLYNNNATVDDVLDLVSLGIFDN